MKQEEAQLRACGMTEEAKALRKKWRVLTRDYQIYSIQNDRAYYPYRYIVDRTEVDQGNWGTEKPQNPLTNEQDSGTINMREIDIEVDIATPCLIDKQTGAIVKTEMKNVPHTVATQLDKTKEYEFSWRKVVADNPNCTLATLHVKGNPTVEGVVAFEKVKSDNSFKVFDIEKPKHNRGSNGKYAGVAKHLFAYVSKIALDQGLDCIEFLSKTSRIKYYQETLGAKMARGQMMYLDKEDMQKLVDIYYPKGETDEKK